jgi:hypothetical protein
MSLPSQLTIKLAEASVAGSGVTELLGGVTSSVFDHVGVAIDGFWSNTIAAWLLMIVPVGSELLALAVTITAPPAPGGKNPTEGSAGGCPVFGLIDCKFHVRMPVDELSVAVTRTIKFVFGLKSTSVEKVPRAIKGTAQGLVTWPLNIIGPRVTLERSNFVWSKVSVITTCWAGRVAAVEFWKYTE